MKTSKEKYDVLIFMSDQHAGLCSGYAGDAIAITPNLDSLAKKGVVFENAYTSCPLCVPARTSFLTGKMPSNVGVYNNASDFRSGELTIAHMFDCAGYQTNLIGRMHFVGNDQHHGFKNRIGVDITANYWGYNAEERKEWRAFAKGLKQKTCLEIIGYGDTPVLDYDRKVVENAIEFYKENHENPQFTIVGTYSPHFPYVCDKSRMQKIQNAVEKNYRHEEFLYYNSPCKNKVQNATKDDIILLRSAYYAMIEILDEQVGMVYSQYQEYLKNTDKKGIFIYMSDHGDHIGHNQIYGKQTFFEMSAKIPLIICGDDINPAMVDDAVSIMDILPTLCDMCGVDQIPFCEGESFENILHGEKDDKRWAISEFYDIGKENTVGYMVYQDGYKLITYKGFENADMLFRIKEDVWEEHNLVDSHSEIYSKLKQILYSDRRIHDCLQDAIKANICCDVLKRVGSGRKDLNKYCYNVPQHFDDVENLSSKYIDKK